MIRVKFSLIPQFFLEVRGHAYYNDPGKDIVCSAVSAIVVGGINALENNENMNIEIAQGLIRVKSETTLSDNDQIVFQTIITQLETVIAEYPKFVTIVK